MNPKQVAVTGAFDDIRSRQVRFLEEASKLGDVTVLLWSDEAVNKFVSKPPKFPEAERLYFLQAIRYVNRVVISSSSVNLDSLPALKDFHPQIWVDDETSANLARRTFCEKQGISYHVLRDADLRGFPDPGAGQMAPAARKKVIVTGSYDWFHSGHVRFFEQASAYGDLYVTVGHDANLRLLKGEGHPMFPQDERRYLVGSIRFVKQALIASGDGWLDAEPEILRLKPDIYAVNDDGDRGGKREFCEKNGIQYLVLKRTPAPGLPKRTSTDLRGF